MRVDEQDDREVHKVADVVTTGWNMAESTHTKTVKFVFVFVIKRIHVVNDKGFSDQPIFCPLLHGWMA